MPQAKFPSGRTLVSAYDKKGPTEFLEARFFESRRRYRESIPAGYLALCMWDAVVQIIPGFDLNSGPTACEWGPNHIPKPEAHARLHTS